MASKQQVHSEIDVATSVKAQAKLRALLGLAIIICGLTLLSYRGVPDAAVGFMVAIHVTYIGLMTLFAMRLRPFSAEQLALATAILDPLILTAWLPLLGEFGGLVVGFYLFTILGFGFRLGLRLMQICQVASIVGFVSVINLEAFWKQHYVVTLSFLVMLIVVPFYAGILIKKLHEARSHAERESKAKSQLLAKVSHELRTPLSGIVAAAQLLLAEAQSIQVTKRADTIMGLSKDLLREINDLLDSAKHEAKALVLESAVFTLDDVMDRVGFTLAEAAAAKGIDFKIDVDPNIHDRLQGDSHYLSRVLINLAGNAVKFTEKGKVEVFVRLLEEHADHYRIHFGVKDTGIGIQQELHKKIFEPFFQASSGTTRQYGGTGLGMAIAKEIVNLMGSDIRLESEPGKGSLFHFDLSFLRVKGGRKAPERASSPIVYGKRMLIADDNETILTLMKELLEKDGHEVVAAKNGIQALDALTSGEYDVIFLDFNMGDMDGAKVLQIYRFGKLNAAPAFFLTADGTETTATVLRESGAMGVLTKPITSDGLRQAIFQACERGPQHVTTGPMVKQEKVPLKTVPTQYIEYSVIEDLTAMSQRPEFLNAVLGDAISDIERNCGDLLEALAAREATKVRDTAHALKGVCASVGAGRLASLASKLMRISSHELKHAGERWSTDIAETSHQSISALRNIMQERTATR